MSLAAGSKLGPYEILAPIGAGGMGEVYRARDTKLDRDVALKVLPQAFARDPARMARFEREAKVLASLNHPNIAQIYGVAETDGARALVMELVEGDSPQGPMPFDDAWAIASQMAEALEYAHEKGIVHRDLKPANIKVTPNGTVKLLDFGLAKAFSAERESTSLGNEDSPTLTMGMTEVGVILGTAAYMAPEQARGKPVDKRADVWAFGVVLYELLTGDRLFKGEEAADTLAQVLTKTPDLGRVPPQARKLLSRCLEKDPKNRLRQIGAAKELLAEPIGQPPTEKNSAGPRAIPQRWIWPATAGLLLILLTTLSIIHFRESSPTPQLLRYTIPTPASTWTYSDSLAISPDGRLVALGATVNNKRQLWLRALDAVQAQPIPGTEDAQYPFWSPDSRNIAFFAGGKLKRVAAAGGPPQTICDAPIPLGGSWNRDRVIIMSIGTTPLFRVSASGGVPAEVPGTKSASLLPVFLPDGRRFLYLHIGDSSGQNGIYLGSLDGKDNRRILPDYSNASLSAGRLLFVREGVLMSQPFDVSSGQLSGEASPVAEGFSPNLVRYYPFATAENAILVYAAGVASRVNHIAWFDRGGKLLASVGAPGPMNQPSISPDQKRVLYQRVFAQVGNLWMWDMARGAEQRFTSDPAADGSPYWSPRGDRVVFNSNRSGGVFSLYQKPANGTGSDELLFADDRSTTPSQWSRDGRFLVYTVTGDAKTKYDISVLPMDGGGNRKPIPFLHSEFDEMQGQLSPDSRWMAYSSDESGQYEIYVRPFPESQGQWRISTSGGVQPRWRADGQELYFVGGDGMMTAVPVNAVSPPGGTRSLEVGKSKALFEASLAPAAIPPLMQYDVSPDGQRFLLATTRGLSAPASSLNVVVNWAAGLKK